MACEKACTLMHACPNQGVAVISPDATIFNKRFYLRENTLVGSAPGVFAPKDFTKKTDGLIDTREIF
jgi:hypothetical protein